MGGCVGSQTPEGLRGREGLDNFNPTLTLLKPLAKTLGFAKPLPFSTHAVRQLICPSDAKTAPSSFA
jgi:hypothetical protein